MRARIVNICSTVVEMGVFFGAAFALAAALVYFR